MLLDGVDGSPVLSSHPGKGSPGRVVVAEASLFGQVPPFPGALFRDRYIGQDASSCTFVADCRPGVVGRATACDAPTAWSENLPVGRNRRSNPSGYCTSGEDRTTSSPTPSSPAHVGLPSLHAAHVGRAAILSSHALPTDVLTNCVILDEVVSFTGRSNRVSDPPTPGGDIEISTTATASAEITGKPARRPSCIACTLPPSRSTSPAVAGRSDRADSAR